MDKGEGNLKRKQTSLNQIYTVNLKALWNENFEFQLFNEINSFQRPYQEIEFR